jgi:hypothetical protein
MQSTSSSIPVVPTDTSQAVWWHGAITREESMRRLAFFPDGSYLVRESTSRLGCFSLDFITNGGSFVPLLVERTPGGVKVPSPSL